jgi:sulfopyruvate decarboxylase TPP-binding subunit
MSPTETLRTLVATGITHVVGLPDSISGPLFDAVTRHPAIRLVTVTREGEAFAIACGLWIGGAQPLVVIQNTGLLESGDSLRGTAQRMAAPVPVLITGRGYRKMHEAGITPDDQLTVEWLRRADVDSVAVLTEPTLEAWGVPFRRCEGEDDPAAALLATIEDARAEERPVALVVARKLT